MGTAETGLFFSALHGAFQEWRRWSRISDTGGSVRVYYGKMRVPRASEPAVGGIIKCQDLINVFPNTLSNPNILYIVSSSLVPHVVSMARFAKRAGAKLVVNQNGVAYPAWHGAGWERTNRPLQLLLERADHVFYQSAFGKASADRFLGSCRGSCEILHNPVDTAFFTPARPLPPSPLILLQAGSHGSFYRVEAALRTLHELVRRGHDVRLLLAGRYFWRTRESDAIAEVHRLARSLGVDQHLDCRGFYTQADSLALFRSAHLLLHTQYNDCCPRLVVEAMACGLPIVYSATGGVPELVGDDAGVGVPGPVDWEKVHPPDPGSLASAVEKVIEEYSGLSAGARRRAVADFDVKAWIRRHQQVFERLVAG